MEPSSGFRLPVFNSVFLIVLISFMFLFAIALLIGNKRGYFKKKHSEFDDDLIFEEVKIDYITKEQIKQLLQTARNQKNYKVAIRSIYLLTIWELGDKEIITISEHKTNYDYNYEIAQAEVRSIFKTITTTYDYIWYGEFTAEQKHFESTERAYKQLISQL